MAAFYIIFKVTALLAIIVIPLSGPKKRKGAAKTNMSKLAVNESGYLENFNGKPVEHQPM